MSTSTTARSRRAGKAVLAGSIGAGLGLTAAAGPVAASSPWPTEYTNNGCTYAFLVTDGSGGTAMAQVWDSESGGADCSGGYVELHYLDSNKDARVAKSTQSWSVSGGAATVVSRSGTFQWSCVRARSRDAGNWSVPRTYGSNPGTCGSP